VVVDEGGPLILNPNYEAEAAAFFRRITLPHEDWHRYTTEPYRGGAFRWFRAPNIIPIEKYRRRRHGHYQTGHDGPGKPGRTA
jgi:hypothetical protein